MTKDNMMAGSEVLKAVEAFARRSLDADRFPHALHRFRPLSCDTCGVVPLAVTIEHHTGSMRNNFRGVIFGHCRQCDIEQRIWSFTGAHRRPERQEPVACTCGGRFFLVAECERIEREEGLPGFVDEGVVVAACTQCNRRVVLVSTD